MFEILSVLIVYVRGSLKDRLKLMLNLYCFEEKDSMQLDEFKFIMEKLSISFGSILSIKSCLVRDGKIAETRILPDKK